MFVAVLYESPEQTGKTTKRGTLLGHRLARGETDVRTSQQRKREINGVFEDVLGVMEKECTLSGGGTQLRPHLPHSDCAEGAVGVVFRV